MRAHVPFLDTGALPWTEGAPGRFVKILSDDPATGARTALSRSDPTAPGFKAQPRAHYHYIDEELFCLSGRFTFDGENWLTRLSYVFYPAGTVHGHRSAVPEEYSMISRATGHMTWTYLDSPLEPKPYLMDGFAPERSHALHVSPLDGGWTSGGAFGPSAQQRVLSIHPATGEGSMLVRLPAGWASPAASFRHSAYQELFVLEGGFDCDDGRRFGEGCYSFTPPHVNQARARSSQGVLLYVNTGGPLDGLPPR